MTTPNIEELFKTTQNYLSFHKQHAFFASDRDVANKLTELLNALQSQAERIAELEKLVRQEEQIRITYVKECANLRAQLAQYVDEPSLCVDCNGSGEGRYEGTRCHACKGKGEV